MWLVGLYDSIDGEFGKIEAGGVWQIEICRQ